MLGKKSSEKKCENVFYIHTNIVTKNGLKKRAKQFIQKHKNSAIKKCWEKYRRKKVRKTFFYIHTNIVTKKWGEQNARNNFSKNTIIVRAKNGKKSSEKSAKNVFLYSHEYRDQQMGGKNARNNIFRKYTNSASKKCWLTIVGKKCEKRFFIFTRIS